MDKISIILMKSILKIHCSMLISQSYSQFHETKVNALIMFAKSLPIFNKSLTLTDKDGFRVYCLLY